MRRPQIVAFERDGRLAGQLGELTVAKRLVVRESRQLESCLRLIADPATVLVIRLGPDTETELNLLAQTASQASGVRIVAVSDGPPGLASLAWDLGADYVMTGLAPPDRLSSVIAGLMGSE